LNALANTRAYRTGNRAVDGHANYTLCNNVSLHQQMSTKYHYDDKSTTN